MGDAVIKFVHAADMHIDSPMLGLERYADAPADELRGATRRALDNLVRLAIEEEAAFVVIAGDLFDREWRDYNTGLYFHGRMLDLGRHGIRVFLVNGNHDAESEIGRSLRLPDNVHCFSVRHPETRRLDDLGVAVHGQGYARAATTEDLSLGYPAPVPGFVNVGLLHTSAGGREGHADYAPCSVEGLRARGYDYWALGHVHRREVLSRDPWVVWSGNTQGRHARETGEKGCMLVTVDGMRIESVRFEPLDVLRWERVEIDLADLLEPAQAVEAGARRIRAAAEEAQGRLLAVRVALAGRGPVRAAWLSDSDRWTSELRARAAEATHRRAWVEKVVPAAPESGVLADATGADLGELVGVVDDVTKDGAWAGSLPGLFTDLRARLPFAALEGEGAVPLADASYLAARLAEARDLLAARLGAAREGER